MGIPLGHSSTSNIFFEGKRGRDSVTHCAEMLLAVVEHHNLDLLAGVWKTYMAGDVTDNLALHPLSKWVLSLSAHQRFSASQEPFCNHSHLANIWYFTLKAVTGAYGTSYLLNVDGWNYFDHSRNQRFKSQGPALILVNFLLNFPVYGESGLF